MNCPVCLLPMKSLKLEEIEIDPCIYCGGLWLDKGELAAFIRKGKIPERLVSTFCLDMRKMKMMDGERNCPRCNVQFKIIDYDGVFVDFCPQCEGFWFDRGELLKILQIFRFNEGLLDDSHPIVRELLSGGSRQDIAVALPDEAYRQKVNLKLLSSGRPKTAAKIREDSEVIKAPEFEVIKAPEFIKKKTEQTEVESESKPSIEKPELYKKKTEQHKVLGVVAAEFLVELFPFLFKDAKR